MPKLTGTDLLATSAKDFRNEYGFGATGDAEKTMVKIWGHRERAAERDPGKTENRYAEWTSNYAAAKQADANLDTVLQEYRKEKIKEWNVKHGWTDGARVAHHFWRRGNSTLAAAVQSEISSVYNVDIHPASRWGRGIVMDHAGGCVIGETSVIGDNVYFMHDVSGTRTPQTRGPRAHTAHSHAASPTRPHGIRRCTAARVARQVTLGATGKDGDGDRHPKLGARVLVGAGASVLGNIRVGDRAKIGCGSVVLKPIPPDEPSEAQAARLGLDLARTVRFRVGFFNESLSALLREEPALRLSVLRMDGDTYASTMETLELMYDRVSPGGFVIADDYLDWEGCRAAVHEFRAARNISEPIVLTPHSPEPQGPHLPGAPPEILRSVYWRKGGAGAPLPDCVGAPAGALRITGSYNPGRLRCVSEVGRPLRAPAGLALSKAATTHPIRPTSARELLHMCEP